jgi:adenosylcobyric acid synthase
MEGLGLLPVETTFAPEKTTVQVRGRVMASDGPIGGAVGTDVTAYEIHMGHSGVLDESFSAAFVLDGGRPDGLGHGNVLGTYLHGLFDNAPVRRALLAWAAKRKGLAPEALEHLPSAELDADAEFDRLAGVLRESLDFKALRRIAGLD